MRYCTKQVKDFVIFTIFVDSGWGEVAGGGGECVIILGDLEGVRANLPLM